MDKVISYQYFKCPVGELIIGAYDGQLCICDWRYRKMRSTVDKRIMTLLKAEMVEEDSSVIVKCITQLEEYFARSLKEFDLPLLMVGSAFQQSVWEALVAVPYGRTVSYLELARQLENEGAIRAVASANGANALAIIVPCHRIIGSDGDLTGYAGGLPAKKKLLELEGMSRQTQLF